MSRADTLAARIRTISGLLAAGAAQPIDQRAAHAALQFIADQVEAVERDRARLNKALDEIVADGLEEARLAEVPTSDPLLIQAIWGGRT